MVSYQYGGLNNIGTIVPVLTFVNTSWNRYYWKASHLVALPLYHWWFLCTVCSFRQVSADSGPTDHDSPTFGLSWFFSLQNDHFWPLNFIHDFLALPCFNPALGVIRFGVIFAVSKSLSGNKMTSAARAFGAHRCCCCIVGLCLFIATSNSVICLSAVLWLLWQ